MGLLPDSRKLAECHPKGLGFWDAGHESISAAVLDLLESEDPKALTEFALMWSDLMEVSIVPVLEDQDLAEVLRRIGK